MQQLIRERGMDRVTYVGQRASSYETIDRLRRDELIAVRETVREAQRPERTVYEITDAGRVAVLTWMRQMLSTPHAEFPVAGGQAIQQRVDDHEDNRSGGECQPSAQRSALLVTVLEQLE
ncbi:MAG: helix-turn-helix transcriptional regulator [Pseudonocardiaceae bacterium]